MNTAEKLVQELGIIDGLSNEQYRNMRGVSASVLKNMVRSPAHARFKMLNPTEQTPAMLLGVAAHAFTLESGSAKKLFCQRPEGMRAGTKAYEAFLAENPGKTELSFDAYNDAVGMSEAVLKHHIAGKLVRGGSREVSAFWIDESTELTCKARPDILREDGMIVDLKTTTDASPRAFSRQIAELGYHIQAAHYLEGINKFVEVKDFVVIAVENKAPYEVAVYYLDFGCLEKGRDERRNLLDLYAQCKKTDIWPGYSQSLQPISLPSWAF